MEQDRFQENSKLFIVGLICLLLCLSLLAIGLYIVPFLIWNWHYSVPGMVIQLREWYKETYNFTNAGASWLVFLTFIVPALICGVISRWATNTIDKEIFGVEESSPDRKTEIHEDIQETVSFGLKIAVLIVLVILAVSFVDWMVTLPSI